MGHTRGVRRGGGKQACISKLIKKQNLCVGGGGGGMGGHTRCERGGGVVGLIA